MNNLDISKAQNTVPKVTRQMTKQFMRYFKTKYRQDFPNLLKPTGHVMHQQFNIQQLYALPTLYLCVLCLSENKERFVPLTS